MTAEQDDVVARLDEIEGRATAASAGPWHARIEGRDHTSGDDFIRTGTPDDDAPDRYVSLSTDAGTVPAPAADLDFIAHARQDIPDLTGALRLASAARKPVESSSAIEFLQRWYADQCDGDWEHRIGMSLGTLDNPGWRLAINLEDTELEAKDMPRQTIDRSEDDWIHVWKEDLVFNAAGGPFNLVEMLAAFRRFADSPR